MTKLYCVLFLAAALAGPGQAASVPPGGTGAANPTSGVRRSPLSDAQIERSIKAKLAKSKMSTVGRERFTVSVKDGVATLEGKTSVMQHKGIATRIARTSGAVAVNNLIEISDAAKARAVARLKGQTAPAGQAMPGKPLPVPAAPTPRATVLPGARSQP